MDVGWIQSCFGEFLQQSRLEIRYIVYHQYKNIVNSCERLLLGTLILDIKHRDNKPQIGTHKFDFIYYLMENGLRHASGPVHAKHPIRYMYIYFAMLYTQLK